MKLEWKTCFKAGISIFLLYLCINYWNGFVGFLGLVLSASLPLLIGALIAYLVNIPMSFFERHFFPNSDKKLVSILRKPCSLIAAILSGAVIITAIFGLVIPQLRVCVEIIFSVIPGYIEKMVEYADKMNLLPENVQDMLSDINWNTWITNIISVITSGLGGIMGTVVDTVSKVFSGIITAVLSVIFSLYILLSKDTLDRQIKKVLRHYIKHRTYKRINHVFSVFNDSFHKFIVGQCTEALILGALCTIGMLILQIPYATMIGALVAFTALIPVAGAFIGAGVGAFMILTADPFKALVFLIFIVVLQQLEGNIIYPKVVGTSIGLPGIWVLTAVTVCGGIFGIAGMFIGVPLFASVYKMLGEELRKPPRHGENHHPDKRSHHNGKYQHNYKKGAPSEQSN
ncbi:MAG: AI-2E family transporter [Ruminococcaceae bacterium]|nr:AI-2E family transporter [Oscillospiraceae bacterium]